MKNLKSFTLIELVMYVALSSTIVFSITVLAVMCLQIREKNKAILEVENQGAYILDKLTHEIRNARNVNTPLATATSQNLILDEDEALNDPTEFSVTDNILKIKQGSAATQDLNSPNISIADLSFSNLSTGSDKPSEIKITFKATYSVSEIKYEKNFYGSASQRNIP